MQLYSIADSALFDWALFRRLRARGEARADAGGADLRQALELAAPTIGRRPSTRLRTPARRSTCVGRVGVAAGLPSRSRAAVRGPRVGAQSPTTGS